MSLLRHLIEVIKLLDKPEVEAEEVAELIKRSDNVSLDFKVLRGDKGSTLFVKTTVRGKSEKPVLGVIGRLGGVSARPHLQGLVSDADGAIVALTVAYKLAEMSEYKDFLEGTVIVTTHITTHAPIKPYKPVPMMDSPVEMYTLLREEVDSRMESIISIDATKANRVVNHTGIAITPIVRDGWILKPSDELLDVYVRVTGEPPVLVPLTTQDITPFTTSVYHINSIVQPWVYSRGPVLGVATTARMPVPGSATGATNAYILEQASRFVLEVAKDYTAKKLSFHSEEEWNTILRVHGSLREVLCKGLPPES